MAAAWKGIIARRLAIAEPVIRDMASRHYGAEDIGPRLKIHPNTVRQYARRLGIELPNNGRTVYKLDKSTWAKVIPELMAQGLNQIEIGKRLGCSGGAISKFVCNAGIRKVNDER